MVAKRQSLRRSHAIGQLDSQSPWAHRRSTHIKLSHTRTNTQAHRVQLHTCGKEEDPEEHMRCHLCEGKKKKMKMAGNASDALEALQATDQISTLKTKREIHVCRSQRELEAEDS